MTENNKQFFDGPPLEKPMPSGSSAVHNAASVGATFPVSIIGVGNMGGGMARNLLAKGWPVSVYDIDTSKMRELEQIGAVALVKYSRVAIDSIVSIVCVVDAVQTREVLFGEHGLAQAMQLGRTVMLCPTLAPHDVEQMAQELIPFGLHSIDAPMSGGPLRAADGSMSLMVACPQNVFERHKNLIVALSDKVFHVSEQVGDGARTKLVNNLLAGINLVGAAEALALAQRMGLDLNKTLDVIEHSSGQSWIGSDRMRRAFQNDLAPRAHMTLLEKDTRLAIEAAAAVGFHGPLGPGARDVFAAASAGGFANLDDAALFNWLAKH